MIESMVTATTHNFANLLEGREPDQKGRWVHLAKIAYEKYFLHKLRTALLRTLNSAST